MNTRADHHETLSNQIGLFAAGLNGTSFYAMLQLKREIVIYFVAELLEKAPAGDNKQMLRELKFFVTLNHDRIFSRARHFTT